MTEEFDDMDDEFCPESFKELYNKMAEVIEEYDPSEVVAVCCMILAHAIKTSEDPKAAMYLIKAQLGAGNLPKEEVKKAPRKK